jgi:hypothetical protein
VVGEKGNVLYELAQVMATNSAHSVAVALRKLAQAGYGSLDEVDSASDWTLLSIPGLGVGRLGAVRRLTRSGWQPPSPQAVKAVSQFVSAARVARRFWPPELLASLVRGSTLPRVCGGPVEKRLALDVFSQALQRAQRYCEADELVQALWPAKGSHSRGQALENRQTEPSAPDPPNSPHNEDDLAQDSDRFAHPRHRRFEIVQHYWAARERGEVQNKDNWARSRYHISSKTLLSYEREFADMKYPV